MEKLPLSSFMSVALSMMNERINNSVTGNTEMFIDAIGKRGIINNQPCVCNAYVTCNAAVPNCPPVRIKMDNQQVQICDLSELTKKSIKLAAPFEKCTKTPDRKCIGSERCIEAKVWQMADESNSHGPGMDTLNHLTAYMVCTEGPGIIHFINAGQGVKSCFDRLKADSSSDFERELRQKGFPEGYIKYLMILHEKYPKWQFEPVFTNVDYQEFLQFQIDSQIKCAEMDPYFKYCTNRRFEREKDKNYYIANDEAIRFFSHPYSMLQSGDWKYENALQFLKGDQELPCEYVEEVVNCILSDSDDEIVSAILNSDSCINPVFMASIYKGENGPVGELYNGEKIYNLFNVGGDGGRSDSIKYAYDHQWFSLEKCIEGSEKTFQQYINRGQDTLYALDWDYQSYSREEPIKQYATLVNDAENKAIMMFKRKDQMFDLNQEFIFSIPVYDNIPYYLDEEFAAYPDPNK